MLGASNENKGEVGWMRRIWSRSFHVQCCFGCFLPVIRFSLLYICSFLASLAKQYSIYTYMTKCFAFFSLTRAESGDTVHGSNSHTNNPIFP